MPSSGQRPTSTRSNTGCGRLYLGFHLDPYHAAHWNNLTEPLKFTIEAPETVELSQSVGEAALTPPSQTLIRANSL